MTQKSHVAIACALAIACASCKSSPRQSAGESSGARSNDLRSPSPAVIVDDDIAKRQTQIRALEQKLEGPLAMSTVDCVAICPLVDQICSLAQEICDLAAKRSSDMEATAACDDSKLRCANARKRSSTCTCAASPGPDAGQSRATPR